jgi:ribosome-binding factor A
VSKQTNPSSGPSQRQLRVGELIRHALADILARQRIHDPDLEGRIITIPEVRLTADLKIATVYVMPLGGLDAARIVKALARNARAIKGELGKTMRDMKAMPELRFRFDEMFDEAARIDRLLDDPRVVRDTGAQRPKIDRDDDA